MIPHFTLHRPDADVAVPLIIHVPHASDFVPPHCRGDFALPDGELGAVIAAMIDHDTDRLALAAVPLGAHVFVNNVCRLVMDPERHADDAVEEAFADIVEVAAGWGMGAIYVDTHDGRRLRRADWTDRDRAARLDEFHQPYHRAIRDLVLELRDRFAAPVHIIDLHSFPLLPLPYERDQVHGAARAAGLGGVVGGPRRRLARPAGAQPTVRGVVRARGAGWRAG